MNLFLDEKKLKQAVKNVLNDRQGDGLKLIGHILSMSYMYQKGIGSEPIINAYNCGRKDFGLEIREIIKQYAFDKYVELERQGVRNDDNNRKQQSDNDESE